MIQSFLNWVNFGDICQFLFRDTGYFSKYLKGYGIPGTPFKGLTKSDYIKSIARTMFLY